MYVGNVCWYDMLYIYFLGACAAVNRSKISWFYAFFVIFRNIYYSKEINSMHNFLSVQRGSNLIN